MRKHTDIDMEEHSKSGYYGTNLFISITNDPFSRANVYRTNNRIGAYVDFLRAFLSQVLESENPMTMIIRRRKRRSFSYNNY